MTCVFIEFETPNNPENQIVFCTWEESLTLYDVIEQQVLAELNLKKIPEIKIYQVQEEALIKQLQLNDSVDSLLFQDTYRIKLIHQQKIGNLDSNNSNASGIKLAKLHRLANTMSMAMIMNQGSEEPSNTPSLAQKLSMLVNTDSSRNSQITSAINGEIAEDNKVVEFWKMDYTYKVIYSEPTSCKISQVLSNFLCSKVKDRKIYVLQAQLVQMLHGVSNDDLIRNGSNLLNQTSPQSLTAKNGLVLAICRDEYGGWILAFFQVQGQNVLLINLIPLMCRFSLQIAWKNSYQPLAFCQPNANLRHSCGFNIPGQQILQQEIDKEEYQEKDPVICLLNIDGLSLSFESIAGQASALQKSLHVAYSDLFDQLDTKGSILSYFNVFHHRLQSMDFYKQVTNMFQLKMPQTPCCSISDLFKILNNNSIDREFNLALDNIHAAFRFSSIQHQQSLLHDVVLLIDQTFQELSEEPPFDKEMIILDVFQNWFLYPQFIVDYQFDFTFLQNTLELIPNIQGSYDELYQRLSNMIYAGEQLNKALQNFQDQYKVRQLNKRPLPSDFAIIENQQLLDSSLQQQGTFCISLVPLVIRNDQKFVKVIKQNEIYNPEHSLVCDALECINFVNTIEFNHFVSVLNYLIKNIKDYKFKFDGFYKSVIQSIDSLLKDSGCEFFCTSDLVLMNQNGSKQISKETTLSIFIYVKTYEECNIALSDFEREYYGIYGSATKYYDGIFAPRLPLNLNNDRQFCILINSYVNYYSQDSGTGLQLLINQNTHLPFFKQTNNHMDAINYFKNELNISSLSADDFDIMQYNNNINFVILDGGKIEGFLYSSLEEIELLTSLEFDPTIFELLVDNLVSATAYQLSQDVVPTEEEESSHGEVDELICEDSWFIRRHDRLKSRLPKEQYQNKISFQSMLRHAFPDILSTKDIRSFEPRLMFNSDVPYIECDKTYQIYEQPLLEIQITKQFTQDKPFRHIIKVPSDDIEEFYQFVKQSIDEKALIKQIQRIYDYDLKTVEQTLMSCLNKIVEVEFGDSSKQAHQRVQESYRSYKQFIKRQLLLDTQQALSQPVPTNEKQAQYLQKQLYFKPSTTLEYIHKEQRLEKQTLFVDDIAECVNRFGCILQLGQTINESLALCDVLNRRGGKSDDVAQQEQLNFENKLLTISDIVKKLNGVQE